MHQMLGGIVNFDGLEGSCTDVKDDVRALDSSLDESRQKLVCEMESGRWRSD
jgi:hypothetical protein